LNRYEVLTNGTCISLMPDILLIMVSRGLEAAVQRLSESSKSSGVFTGKGQTLGGATTGPDLKSQANQAASNVTSSFNNIDPQVKVLLGLVVAYAAFWYITS
jgi:thioredoxin 1